MNLTSTQINRFTNDLVEKYKESGGALFWKETEEGIQYLTNPVRYEDLADLIDASGGIVKASWLKALFTEHIGTDASPSFNETILNKCCHYLTGEDAKAYFKGIKVQVNYTGRYHVWWTGSVENELSDGYNKDFEVEIGEHNVTLYKDGNLSYRGSKGLLIINKLHLELTSLSHTEKVYFILDVGEASKKYLHYIPGVFAAGDRVNLVPSCGMVLFILDGIPPNKDFIKAYFEKPQNQNFIQGWSLSSVLEEWKQRNTGHPKKVKDISAQINHKLNWFLNQCFYFYYYRSFHLENSREDGIARGILEIGNTPENVNLTTMGVDSHVTYFGTLELVYPSILFFKLVSTTRERHLSIYIKIATGEMNHLAVGTFINIGRKGEPLAGLTLIEYMDKDNKDRTPILLRRSDPAYQNIHKNFRRFFWDRRKNILNTFSKGIFSHENLEAFFTEQDRKRHQPRPFIKGITRIFIASPMSSNIADYEMIRPYAMEVLKFLREEAKFNVFYAGEKYHPDLTLTSQTYYEAEVNLKELNHADHVFLIYPGKIASSALVEIGFALGQDKTCHILVENKKDLPFLLRYIRQPNVTMHDYLEPEEILGLVKQIIGSTTYY